MTQPVNIGPLSLQADYLAATDNFMELQLFANLLAEQIDLDVPVDAGLAYKISTFQSQMKSKASYVNNEVLPSYIEVLTLASNFYSLWQAFYETEAQYLSHATVEQRAKDDAYQAASALAMQSTTINQSVKAFADDLSITSAELERLSSSFDTALNRAIEQLGTEGKDASATIDALNAAITQNIHDIVAGANQVGSSVNNLLIGTLTMIANAKPDQGEEADKKDKDDKKDKNSEEDTDNEVKKSKSDKGADKSDGGETAPSNTFVVESIQGAEEGAAQTAQARADLNANNVRLAAAYQSLAQLDAMLTVAKVVQVQNGLFANALKSALSATQKLSDTWGQVSQIPPGGGVSLGFEEFAKAVGNIASQADVTSLTAQLNLVNPAWLAFNKKLGFFRQALTSQS